jgi:hypothetical protein
LHYYALDADKLAGYRILHFQAQLDSLLDSPHEYIERLSLSVTSAEGRYIRYVIPVLVSLDDNVKLLHHIALLASHQQLLAIADFIF